jgi:hypothetical protein
VRDWCLAIILIACLASPAPAQRPAPWPTALVNPQPLADDVVMPMPCGGAMAFRRVAVPAAGPLDDRRLSLGGVDDRFGWAEAPRGEALAAGFTDPAAAGQRFYLLGKYEVTRAQMAALGANCPALDGAARLPRVEVTWAEATAFAAAYAAWAVANARDRLPTEGGVPGFFRLPTEVEWEFAARGGLAVPENRFADPLPPMEGALSDHAWHQGTQSANNELQAIGLLKANPLGFHDMLGNAGEFALDPFRLNKSNRLHGQAGGHVVRGGDFTTAPGDLRSAQREEFAPVDARGERRLGTVGFRLALVPPVLPSPQRLRQLQQAWRDLPRPPAGAPPQDDPVREVDLLAEAVEDPLLKRRIQALGTVVRTNVQTRNEQRDRAARTTLQLGTYLVVKLAQDQRVVAARETIARSGALGAETRRQIEEQLAADRRTLTDTLDYYLDTVRYLATDFPEAVIGQQAAVLAREFEARDRAVLVPSSRVVLAHTRRFMTEGKLDRDAARRDIPP